METLVLLRLPPGVYRNGTKYQSKSRWFDSHLMRFHEGQIRPVGGWVLNRTATGLEIQATGKPRGSHAWRKNDSTSWLATGTQAKLYVYSNGVLTDITPAGLTAGVTDGQILAGGGGWGEGGWGDGPWGGFAAFGSIADADTWQLDNFGEILIACLTADGKLYESTPTAQATQITNSPTGCRGVCVTSERFIFALGASSDPRNVAWCSQAARTIWTPAASNSAGSFPLQTNGRLIAGRRTARETLLWTDTDLWGAVYIGGPLVYSFQPRGDNCGLIGPNAIAFLGSAAYWMGDGRFFRYDGAVREIPCDVADFVFGDLNTPQRAKIAAVPVDRYGEVWWYYPSATQSGSENDRAVSVNEQGQWMLHRLDRAAGSGRGAFSQPMKWAPDGRLYSHETGNDRGGQASYLESGPLEIAEGDRVLRIQSLLPDEQLSGHVQATFFTAFEPLGIEVANGPYTLSPRTDVRLTARQLRLRLTEVVVPAEELEIPIPGGFTTIIVGGPEDFRIGNFRLGVIAGGYR